MNTIILICNKFNVKPLDIAKKKYGSMSQYTYKDILSKILLGQGSLTKDFPELNKDTVSALLKKLFPGKIKISQSWRAYLLETICLKRCSKCAEIKERSGFSTNTKEPDGLRAQCKVCSSEGWKAHYYADPEKHKERVKEYYVNNKATKLEYNKAYYYANPDVYAQHRVKRQLRELEAVANWADLEEINEIYINCPKGYHVDHIIPLQGKLVSGLHTENNLQYLTASDNLHKSNIFDSEKHIHIIDYISPYSKPSTITKSESKI